MQMPETPDHIADLDLLKRLDAYRERVAEAFGVNELPALGECLKALSESNQSRQVKMSRESISVAHRAQKALGDLNIGSTRCSWRIDSFKLQ